MVQTFGRIFQSGSGWVKGVLKLDDGKLSWTNPVDGKEDKVQESDLVTASWTGVHSGCILKLKLKGGASLRYTGFKSADFEAVKSHFEEKFSTKLDVEALNSAGHNWGNLALDGNSLTLAGSSSTKTVFELSLGDIAQCAFPAKDEVEIQFTEANAGKAETVVSMKLFIPEGAQVRTSEGAEDGEGSTLASAQAFQQKVVELCGLGENNGDVLVEFKEKDCLFLTPRGRYRIEMYDKEMRLHGKTYDYNIQYKHVARLYLLPKKADGSQFAFVISLSVPIMQGAQQYAHLVMQLSNNDCITRVNLTQEEIDKKYKKGKLGEEVTGQLYRVFAKVFRTLIGKKIYTTGKFKNFRGDKSIKCALKSHEGSLFPLEKSFFFIHKPPTFITFQSIISVEFQRYSNEGSNAMRSRTFDLQVVCKAPGGRTERDITFQGIGRNEYSKLFKFLSDKNIPIKNIKSMQGRGGVDVADNDSEDDDSDFSGGGSSSEDDDDYEGGGSDGGSGSGSGSSSDEGSPKKKKKKSRKRSKKSPKSGAKSKKYRSK